MAEILYQPFTEAAATTLKPFEAMMTRGSFICMEVAPLVVAALSILISYRAFQAIMGRTSGAVLYDVMGRAMRVVACVGCANYLGSNYVELSGIVAEAQVYLAQLFTTNDAETAPYRWSDEKQLFVAIDTAVQPFLVKMHDVSDHALGKDNLDLQASSLMGLIALASATVSSASVLAFSASITLMLLYFRAALAVCILVAPLFIIFLGFQSTSRMFYSWLSTTVSYVFSAGIAAIPVGIALSQLQTFGVAFGNAVENIGVGGSKGLDLVVTPLLATLTMGMMGYLSLRLPPLAARLVGGMVSPPSPGEAMQAMGAARGMAPPLRGSNLNGGNHGAGSTARGANGRFISGSPVAGSPLHTASMAFDKGVNLLSDLKNQTLSAPRANQATRAKATPPSNRAPQQTVADRQRNNAAQANKPGPKGS
jgi:TrbL/VirB6 plasmid conjugal transfer protein